MKVAVIMGSKSDLDVVKKAVDVFNEFGVEYEIRALSAHRTPKEVHEFAAGARENGFEAIVAAAGKAAHLPGVIASATTLPVIGLPIKSSCLDGMDALLSIVQMPSGIPVATVGINAAENAALLAVQILSVKHPELVEKMAAYRKAQSEKVLFDDMEIRMM